MSRPSLKNALELAGLFEVEDYYSNPDSTEIVYLSDNTQSIELIPTSRTQKQPFKLEFHGCDEIDLVRYQAWAIENNLPYSIMGANEKYKDQILSSDLAWSMMARGGSMSRVYPHNSTITAYVSPGPLHNLENSKKIDDECFDEIEYGLYIPGTFDQTIGMITFALEIPDQDLLNEFVSSYLTKREDTNLIDILLAQGIDPVHAEYIAQEFEDLKQVSPTEIASKNQVFYCGDSVIKFVSDKVEANIESKVNYHLSRDQRLSHLVPRSDLESAIEAQIGDSKKHITIQEKIKDASIRPTLAYWLKALAHTHVYGTEVMDKLRDFQAARSMTQDLNDQKVYAGSLKVDKSLRKDLIDSGVGSGTEFIHQDFRSANRVGHYAVDWGHAGRGDPYLDLSRLLLDAEIQSERPFTDDNYKQCLSFYLTEKNKALRVEAPTREDVDTALSKFKSMGLLLSQYQGTHLNRKADSCSSEESKNLKLFEYTARVLEQEHTRELAGPNLVVKQETKNATVYFLPNPRKEFSKVA
tara:strand:- start:3685 stop:5259 length:1575 start_codon:yes stop_codon:yes gene_type:complete